MIAIIDRHDRKLDRIVIQKILQALWGKHGIYIRYSSLNSGENENYRLIWPTRLIDTGFRWHVRALTVKTIAGEKQLVYRDFLLARFTEAGNFAGESEDVPDSDWNTHIRLVLEANTNGRLEVEKQTIEREFGMKGDEVVINTNVALLNYVLQRYQTDVYAIKNHPEKNLLRIKNIDEIKKYLWRNP